MLFTQTECDKTLRLHEKSYRLFTWLNSQMKYNRRNMGNQGNAVSVPDAAIAWIKANANSLPAETKVEASELEEFSKQFTSYLATSFEVVDKSVMPNCNGCFCCGTMQASGQHLKVRSLGKHAKETALNMKAITLQNLARKLGKELSLADAKDFVAKNEDIGEQITLVAYTEQLSRRSTHASQGEGVLALWRELAEPLRLQSRAPRKKKEKYQLNTKKILEAQNKVAERLKAA